MNIVPIMDSRITNNLICNKDSVREYIYKLINVVDHIDIKIIILLLNGITLCSIYCFIEFP